MSIRHGAFLQDTDIEISAGFTDAAGLPFNDVAGVKLTIRKPDRSLTILDLEPIEGRVGVDILADQVGEWRIRLEYSSPSRSAEESRFLVVASSVL